MPESRLIRELRAQQEAEAELEWFAEMLLEALQIPDVRAAVVAAMPKPITSVAPRQSTREQMKGARRRV